MSSILKTKKPTNSLSSPLLENSAVHETPTSTVYESEIGQMWPCAPVQASNSSSGSNSTKAKAMSNVAWTPPAQRQQTEQQQQQQQQQHLPVATPTPTMTAYPTVAANPMSTSASMLTGRALPTITSYTTTVNGNDNYTQLMNTDIDSSDYSNNNTAATHSRSYSNTGYYEGGTISQSNQVLSQKGKSNDNLRANASGAVQSKIDQNLDQIGMQRANMQSKFDTSKNIRKTVNYESKMRDKEGLQVWDVGTAEVLKSTVGTYNPVNGSGAGLDMEYKARLAVNQPQTQKKSLLEAVGQSASQKSDEAEWASYNAASESGYETVEYKGVDYSEYGKDEDEILHDGGGGGGSDYKVADYSSTYEYK